MAVLESKFGVQLYGVGKPILDDFAGVDAPKLKFNFTVKFNFNLDMITIDPESTGSEDPYGIYFGIKQITRPSPIITYEDVNYYNFMTKVATKVDFGIVSITLYDDRKNRAHNIFQKYMEAISPLTRNPVYYAPLLDRTGMTDGGLTSPSGATIGPLENNAKDGPIRSIRVTHFTNHTGQKVMYDYLNPKIQNVTLDELDMTQSDVNTITFAFVYDSYNVLTEAGRQSSGNTRGFS